jgi:t-SNARE complex subunit (syntaxin)
MDFMETVIDQRKDDINSIANIMNDINAIAKDIAVETKAQGEKLEKLDENMEEADTNAEKALKELKGAENHNKKTGKCTYVLIGIIIICLLILIFAVL